MISFATHRKRIFYLSVLFGLLMALLTRVSFFAFSPDFRYYKLGGLYHPAQFISLENIDFFHKPILGISGFPFPVYLNCAIRPYGASMSLGCDGEFIGEWSIVLNTLFWVPIFYLLMRVIQKIKNIIYNSL